MTDPITRPEPVEARAVGLEGADDELEAEFEAWELDDANVDPGDPDAAVFVDDDAEALLGRRARLAAEIGRVSDLVDLKIARLRRWRDERTNARKAEVERIDDLLTEYLEWLREADPSRKSLALPSGSVASRDNTTGRVVIDDLEALMEYLEGVSEGDRETATTTKPSTKGIREICKVGPVGADEGDAVLLYGGEPVPGVHVEGLGRSYTVRGAK